MIVSDNGRSFTQHGCGVFCLFFLHSWKLWKLDPNEAGDAKTFQFILKRKNVSTARRREAESEAWM